MTLGKCGKKTLGKCGKNSPENLQPFQPTNQPTSLSNSVEPAGKVRKKNPGKVWKKNPGKVWKKNPEKVWKKPPRSEARTSTGAIFSDPYRDLWLCVLKTHSEINRFHRNCLKHTVKLLLLGCSDPGKVWKKPPGKVWKKPPGKVWKKNPESEAGIPRSHFQ